MFREGTSFALFPFRVYLLWTPADGPSLQAGFTVSAKNFKKATFRNRIKRVMREAYRLQKYPLDQILQQKGKNLALFFIYTSRDLPDFAATKEKMELALKKIIQKTNEGISSDM